MNTRDARLKELAATSPDLRIEELQRLLSTYKTAFENGESINWKDASLADDALSVVKPDPIPLLDHGYLSEVEYWGSDARIVEAARMSTGKGFLGWGPFEDGKAGDEKLLQFLYQHKHATPFEMAGMVFEVQAPIMVFREWHRHRTQSYNEMSARYIPLPDVNFVPSVERCMRNSTTNKQAGVIAGAGQLTHTDALAWLSQLEDVYIKAQEVYQNGLRMGIPKELARLPVPVGRYSRMRASTCLRNWLAFMTLRSSDAAQEEIRVYSRAIGDLLEKRFPRTMALFRGEKLA